MWGNLSSFVLSSLERSHMRHNSCLLVLLNCHNRANSSLCFIVPKTSVFRPKKRFIEVCHSDLFPAQGKKGCLSFFLLVQTAKLLTKILGRYKGIGLKLLTCHQPSKKCIFKVRKIFVHVAQWFEYQPKSLIYYQRSFYYFRNNLTASLCP